MYDLRKRVQSCKLASRFSLGPRISCMSSQVFSLLHLATLVLSPKCLEITNFNHHRHLFSKLNIAFTCTNPHLHQPFLDIHSSDGLVPCAKCNEWKKLQTLFQKLAITKPYLPCLMHLLSSWKEHGIKLATDGTFQDLEFSKMHKNSMEYINYLPLWESIIIAPREKVGMTC